MRKIWIWMAILLPCLATYAQEQHVEVTEQNPSAHAQFNGMMNVFVSLEAPNVEGYANVRVEVENLDDEQVLLFFAHEYSEEGKKLKKELKKDKIIPDKYFHDEIIPYEGLKKVLKVEPQCKEQLPVLSIPNGEEMACKLPVYVGTFKNSKRKEIILMNQEVFTLYVKAGKGGPSEYSKLKEQVEKLVKKVNGTVICTSSKHKPKAASQKQNLQKEIDKLVAQLEKQRDKWAGSLQTHQNYQNLIDQLQALTFNEGVCSKHDGSRSNNGGGGGGGRVEHNTDPNANCGYKNYSEAQINQQLNDYYVQIYNSSDRAATKRKVMPSVSALYNCYNNHSHGRKKNKQSAINKAYNKINSIK